MTYNDNTMNLSTIAPQTQRPAPFVTPPGVAAGSEATPALTWNRYVRNASGARRWRRKATPQNARPDLRQVILTSRTLEGSQLTIHEVEQLIALIGPTLERSYGEGGVVERSFWFPHGWGMGLSAEAFDGLGDLLHTIEARLTILLRGGDRRVIADHYRTRTMAADLAEVGWRRDRRDGTASADSTIHDFGAWLGERQGGKQREAAGSPVLA